MPESEPSEKAYLVEVVDRHGEHRRYEVGPAGLLVGRSESCDVLYPSSGLAPRHAYFYSDGNELFVEDLSGADDMFVNDEQVRKVRLHEDDVVRGGRLTMTVRRASPEEMAEWRPDTTPAPSPPPPKASASSERISPLAVASLVFAVLAYQHWFFGLGASMLALFALREIRSDPLRTGRPLAWGALVIGLLGAALNAWFAVVSETPTPRSRDVLQQSPVERSALDADPGEDT
jgi:hypothetical protein